MVVGFADNWLYDVDQPSNSVPRFIVHGVLAFLWFTIVVVQTGLIGKGKVSLHQQVGLFGFVVFICLVVSTSYIYLVKYLDGRFGPLSLMVSSQLVFAVFNCKSIPSTAVGSHGTQDLYDLCQSLDDSTGHGQVGGSPVS